MNRIKNIKNQWLRSSFLVGFLIAASGAHAAPGLVDVYQMAVIHDATLEQARADLAANEQKLTQARSFLLPSVALEGTASFPDVEQSGNNQSATLSLRQPLFNREAFSGYTEAEIGFRLAELNFLTLEQGLKNRVSEAYFALLLAQQTLSFAESREAAEKIQWERAQVEVDVGLASRTDLLQTRSAYDLAMADRIDAENDVDIAQETLRRLTGQPIVQVKTLALAQVIIPDPQLVQLAKQATQTDDFNENLAVQIALEQQNLAEQGITTRQSARWFDINFDLAHSRTSCHGSFNDPRACLSGDNTRASISASFPLYQGGRASSEVAEARLLNQSALSAMRDAREQASLDTRVSLRNLERGQARVNALREAVKSNEAFLDAAEEGYRVGLRNLIDVVTARANLFNAQNNLAQAMQSLILEQLRLKQAVGQLTADDLASVDELLVSP